MMTDRQRLTEFLRQCLLYDENNERHQLAERIGQVQQNERCVRRAIWLMVLLAALAFAGLAYSAVFLVDFPQSLPDSVTRFITKLFCVLGLGSLICIPAFVGLELVYRKELNERREECCRLASELLESRLGKSRALEGGMPETSARKAEGMNHWENNVTVTGSANSQPADHHQERRN